MLNFRASGLAAPAVLVVAGSACSSTGPASQVSPSVANASGKRSPRIVEANPCGSQPGTTFDPDTGQCVPNEDGGSGGSSYGGSPGGGVGSGTSTPAPTPTPYDIACVGTPSQCRGVPCSGSPETIGDLFPIPSSTVGATQTVTDINALWSGTPSTQGGGAPIGWMYQGNGPPNVYGTNLYVQFNYANQTAWSGAAGISLFKIFNVSGQVAPPSGYSTIYPWDGKLPPGSSPYKCETGGATFLA